MDMYMAACFTNSTGCKRSSTSEEREEYALEFLKNIFKWKGPALALTQKDMLIIRDLGSAFQA